MIATTMHTVGWSLGNLEIASHTLKCSTQNLFPEGSSMVAESAAVKPTSSAAWQRVSGATRLMADAKVPRDLYGDGDTA